MEKLIYLHVHGIGEQDPQRQRRFMRKVEEVTCRILRQPRTVSVPPGLISIGVEWDELFRKPKHCWHETLFGQPRAAHPLRLLQALLGQPWMRLIRGMAVLLLWLNLGLLCAMALFSVWPHKLQRFEALAGRIDTWLDRLPTLDLLLSPFLAAHGGAVWAAMTFMLLLLVLGYLLYIVQIRWGDFYAMLRGFEAWTLSDVFLYIGDGQRQQIFEQLLKDLRQGLERVYGKDDSAWPEQLPIVFSGHSLGSVIVYDLLRYASRMWCSADQEQAWRQVPTSIERELEQLQGLSLEFMQRLNSPDRQRIEERRNFLEGACWVIRRLRPVGMFTFGSPIALFMFRNSELLRPMRHKAALAFASGERRQLELDRLDAEDAPRTPDSPDLAPLRLRAWQDICPPQFRDDKLLALRADGAMKWCWLNFWHEGDFIAHRLEPLYDSGSRSGGALRFVEDRQLRYFGQHPAQLHSLYFDQPEVINGIGRHLAQCLTALQGQAGTQSTSSVAAPAPAGAGS